MKTAHPIEIVGHVVFAHPGELHRCAHAAGDGGGFHHGVVHEAPAETAAAAHLVDNDLSPSRPSTLATAAWRPEGVWVGAHSSMLPSCHQAVVFWGSSCAWLTNAY
jgi:hypothetical protein